MGFKNYQSQIVEEFNKELNGSNIQEAAFSIKDMEKVSSLLAKVASKKLGAKFQYAWNEKFNKNDNNQGIGIRYMSLEGQQLRFNAYFKSNSSFVLSGIDYWKKGDTLTEPSLTLTWADDVNIVKIKNQLFDSIKAGKLVSLKVKDLVENTDINFNILDNLEDSNNSIIENKEELRQEFADKYNIPASYATSLSRLKRKAKKLNIETELSEWMNIKTNVGEVTDFSRETEISQKRMTDSNFYADPKYVFDDIREGAKVIGKGLWRSMIVAGQGGIGKTFGIKQTLTSMFGPYEEGPHGKWAYYEGMKGLGMGYYITFLLNKNKVVVIDDSDSIWYKGNLNFMKIITSDSGDRQPTWAGAGTANVAMMSTEEREIYELQYLDDVQEDPNTTFKPPSKFAFEGSFINISNLKGEDFDGAIKSRSIFIDVYLAQRDVLRRLATIMEFEGSDNQEIMEVLTAIEPDAKHALNGTGRYSESPKYMTPEEARKNKTINMRSVGIAKALRRAGFPGWQRAAGLYS